MISAQFNPEALKIGAVEDQHLIVAHLENLVVSRAGGTPSCDGKLSLLGEGRRTSRSSESAVGIVALVGAARPPSAHC